MVSHSSLPREEGKSVGGLQTCRGGALPAAARIMHNDHEGHDVHNVPCVVFVVTVVVVVPAVKRERNRAR